MDNRKYIIILSNKLNMFYTKCVNNPFAIGNIDLNLILYVAIHLYLTFIKKFTGANLQYL